MAQSQSLGLQPLLSFNVAFLVLSLPFLRYALLSHCSYGWHSITDNGKTVNSKLESNALGRSGLALLGRLPFSPPLFRQPHPLLEPPPLDPGVVPRQQNLRHRVPAI